MNASAPPGWRPSFTAKQRRTIGSGAWARDPERRGFFRFSSVFCAPVPFFPIPVFSGNTLACAHGQPLGLACSHYSCFRHVCCAARCGRQAALVALRPAVQSVAAGRAFILRFLPGGQVPQELPQCM